MLQTLVTSTDWDEELGRWVVSTDRQDRIKARYVVHSNGPLNRPKLPAIKGINDFAGHTFIPAAGITLIRAAMLRGDCLA
jgi:cyclohexanone monooxygenase